uniref:EARP complex and GARP complex interacting protein 1 n=1 Tax=Apteryx owenii TaxID=8824 RepID=A0A8B9PY53_APTOW
MNFKLCAGCKNSFDCPPFSANVSDVEVCHCVPVDPLLQARALTPQTAETDAIRFLVGTQSLRYDNQIHIIDFDDENNIINKNVLLHQVGEIWHISASPADKGVLATCYNKTSDSKVVTCAAVWRMPKELESGSHESPDDSSSNAQTLELLCHLDNTAHGNMACVMWEPMGDGKRLISLADNNILLWDLQESSAKAVLSSSTALEGKGQLKFTSGRWSPHHNCTQIATASDTTVRGWDTRSMRSKEPLQDSIIATYEEHEDSVYAVEWSSADPWLFASLSYDGRLVINRVPRALKYHILL